MIVELARRREADEAALAAIQEIVEGKPHRNRWNPYSDDDVLAWWEFYAETRNLTATAERFGVSVQTVHRRLEELGVFEETPTRIQHKRKPHKREPRPADPDCKPSEGTKAMINRILSGEDRWTDEERLIAAALRKVNSMEPTHPIHLPYAKALPHVKHVKHRIPMSKRERALDAMASAAERKYIRIELSQAGLMTNVVARKTGRYFT